MSATTTEQSFEIYYWGKDGQWLAAEGHVDLAAFTAAADAQVKTDVGDLADDELPSGHDEAAHLWFRPITREWFDANTHYGEDVADEAFRVLVDEGALEPCQPDDEGTQAWTTIATGA
jgi:hypothetical protein